MIGTLFGTFLKIGAFTFGGGYAMLALLEHEFTEKRSWLSRQDFLDMAAIAESTPGPLAVNSATYIGYRMAGVRGAVVSTFAVCLPSFVILYLISLCLDAFLSIPYVTYAFRGIQVCVIYLILSAGWRMLRTLPRNALTLVLLAVVFGGMVTASLCAVRISSLWFLLLCGTAGLAAYTLRRLCRKGGPRS